jgi:hypothetical protein
MNNSLGILTDGLVAILLVLTICYCIMLNRRLKLLKADELSLRATISELVTATEIAERAIGGLKLTVHECDMGLGERLRKGERVGIELDRSIVAGKELVERLSLIVSAGRGGIAPVEKPTSASVRAPAAEAAKPLPATPGAARAVAAAAEAFAERLRTKVHGLAA